MADGLFDVIEDQSRLNADYKKVLEAESFAPARAVMERTFARMGDRDGNFRQQFQTNGFNARVWELYLFAALTDAGYTIEDTNAVPDFLLERDGLRWGVEATTANPRPESQPSAPEPLDELLLYLEQELPISLGSPLFSKLSHEYWLKPQLKGMPFVLALESFLTDDAFFISETPLASYLFGRATIGERDAAGNLIVRTEPIKEHRVGDKVIPSGFFEQEGANRIAAVLFSNSGTVSKFSRMAFQDGLDSHNIVGMVRAGWRAVNDPNASEPAWFVYEVGSRRERWGEGLVMIHNPTADDPLPNSVLPDAVHYRLEGDQVVSVAPAFHAFASRTITAVPPGHGT